ncbi:hypothetical protein BKP35_12150 [Anaerobacillus arseniciselenatis]|uniref:Uncharacterized protein n=1 Tax=Anaerobacillus arseniciselenatis TaxID=85682 RepID=A0A1S2LG61_9BACI|nr:hypothetical protein BKP35_12150 [Anaerobacillus arseniciselenatis]
MKKIFALLLVVLMMFTGTMVSAESKSTTSESVKKYEKEILKSFDELGIDLETQKKLLKKLKDGEMLDSLKQENADFALEEIQSLQMNESNIITFSDGSKAKVGSEIIKSEDDTYNDDIGLMHTGLSPGTYTIRTYYNTGLVNAQYYIEAVIRSGSDNDYILTVYDGTATVIGGKKEEETTTLHRRFETSTHYAHSNFRVDYSLFGENFSSSMTLNTLVGNDGYKTGLSNLTPLK